MLLARLGELKDAGLLTREVIEGPPIASIYRLTARGDAPRCSPSASGRVTTCMTRRRQSDIRP
jgi:hypothetical protein